jgi:hypothetical protein
MEKVHTGPTLGGMIDPASVIKHFGFYGNYGNYGNHRNLLKF